MSFNIAIIGAGVVSAITNFMMFLINKKNRIVVFELNKKIAIENSKAMNNAGTGHAGMCENNYVRVIKDDFFVKKSIRIYCKFNLTKNFFSWIKFMNFFDFKRVLTRTPHVSFFFKKKNAKLKKIVNKLRFFNKSIKFTNNIYVLNKIFPLLIKKKKIKKNHSISYYKNGFDINYQFLSKKIFSFLTKKKFINLYLSYKVIKIKKVNNSFLIKIFKNKYLEILVDFVFVCAGGSTLNLLKRFDKDISRKYFELPIDGSWLINEDKDTVLKHNLKVYSETIKGNPPMSIPHLDVRTIFKEKKILFGPFAGLTFKVLVNTNKTIFGNLNIGFIFKAVFFTMQNRSIINYLFKENFKTKRRKQYEIFNFTKILGKTYSKKAGKRLQILKKNKNSLKLNFGTKLIFGRSKKIAFLIGASPGASISVSIVANLLNFWFKMPKKFLFKLKNINKKSKIFNSQLYLKGIEPFSF
ncbi:malate:quinone oxidoreductase [Candidatus Carsonella ruddii]|uniref:malate:quinone oxidoreductase n=1 Tax=Carsonella ruddii TaxID=114186 RepID=UPI003D3C60D8